MNNYRIKEYIQDAVISPLERLINEGNGEEVNLYEKYYSQGGYPPKDSVYKSLLHSMMVPYYEMYLNGDIKLCCAGNRLEFIGRKLDSIIEDDDQFGSWASAKDLITAAENWGDNLKRFEKETRRIYRFFHLLEVLLESDCQQDWRALSGELKEMLFKSEVCYDYKTDEVLCVLHAFTMIMQQDWTKDKKKEMLDLLNHKVAETVMTSSQSFKPHMHIFYCGLMDCVDELHLDRKHRRELDKVMLQMQEELNRVKEHSELLYPLCDAIFPEDFQRMLREHRPKSYKEVEDENHRKDELIEQMQAQTKLLHKQLDKTEETLQQMVLSSIPIEKVDDELMKYPPGMAWDMLSNLNGNPAICVQPAWRENYPTLLEKYRNRLYEPIDQQKNMTDAIMKVAERPTYGEYHNYQNGSTHDDKRSQLLLGEEKEKLVPLKRLTNE